MINYLASIKKQETTQKWTIQSHWLPADNYKDLTQRHTSHFNNIFSDQGNGLA